MESFTQKIKEEFHDHFKVYTGIPKPHQVSAITEQSLQPLPLPSILHAHLPFTDPNKAQQVTHLALCMNLLNLERNRDGNRKNTVARVRNTSY